MLSYTPITETADFLIKINVTQNSSNTFKGDKEEQDIRHEKENCHSMAQESMMLGIALLFFNMQRNIGFSLLRQSIQ